MASIRGKPTLYDVPVSNHGARVRMVLYAKKLTDSGAVKISNPNTHFADGGIKSAEYMKLSPQAKLPIIAVEAETPSAPPPFVIAETNAIFSYIVDRYSDVGPSFECETSEARAVSRMITSIHDNYISAIQGCLYKPMDASERLIKLKELLKQLDVLEHHICALGGPYVGGSVMSSGDCTLFPTIIFVEYIAPKFGWPDVFASRPKLGSWWKHMRSGDGGQDDFCNRVYEEVKNGLLAWDENGRWEKVGITEQIEKGLLDELTA